MFRFKKKKKLIDVTVTALAIIFSLVVMFYGIFYFGLRETWLEPILDIFYVACLVMKMDVCRYHSLRYRNDVYIVLV